MLFRKLLTLLLFLTVSIAFAQKNTVLDTPTSRHYLSFQWFGLTFHPGGGSVFMRDNYPLRLDTKAYWVLNIGASVSYDYALSKRFFIRTEGAYFMDCAWQKSACLHVGLHFTPLKWGKHSINGGLGPMFLVRGDWGKFERYRRGDDFFGDRVKNGWQYRFFPIGGEFEYLYQLNPRWQFQYSVIPGYPAVITSKIGARMRF
ncbi:MAG: hypothetical protein JNL70_10535 [Saprospiraceae bacterium]|nr:hypothetical protein [Saprospiraceae bacterium]